MKGRSSVALRQQRESSSVWPQGLQKTAGRKESGGRVHSTKKETRGVGEHCEGRCGKARRRP
ncbi:hypothetical protein B0H19DRAFT_1172380 [Mycena capillaripes]|nr:hypothetical protein B0H19DRAFT_1172380 [Mycena capillaripes]